ncbi:DUF3263 domain-containing protein [Rhodococcus aetherivorans]
MSKRVRPVWLRSADGIGAVSAEDRIMIDFARRWLPFGGPRQEDILVEFGLTPLVFAERVLKLLDAPRALGLPMPEVNALRAMVAGIGHPAGRRTPELHTG